LNRTSHNKKIGVVIARGMPHHQVVKLEVVILVAKVGIFN
jgi:hypothetical protein